ncbi:MAG TPA: hypothetical protein DCZ95_09090 [Verrucomicrobia bacterium]|nr:MAG: hypothetical protein A2X46_03275 [Lentisphaerae bacterium GWF2_57_35]HBA84232.1 hypothetical protein [Verrucomicrobiota bacterium]
MFAALGIAKKYRKHMVNLAQIEGALLYIKGIDAARRSTLALIGAFFIASLLALSFLLLHIAIILKLPWDADRKLIAAIVCTAVYFVLSLFAIFMAGREKFWMKAAHGNAIVQKALQHRARE